MKLSDNHYNLIFSFERFYEFFVLNKFNDVNLTITNDYFINGRFKYLGYSFAFNYNSLDCSLLCSYKSLSSNIVTKRFSNVSSFIEFIETAFINVNRQ